MTIVFADLAGFTERSDQADPEDVRRLLVPFHAVAKEEIERFGGTLDKFIGDAAMGVFGAPVAHEDDPERAVRAALSIRSRMVDGHLPVRIAVHAGEALVTSGVGPLVGEHVAGDVVNTASRLQSFAPEGSVIVGATTERATRGLIAYEPLPATKVKGKAEPLAAFLATGIRADTPEREEDDPPPFVGRADDRSRLRELAARTIADRTPRLVTIVGEPGIGKTRLVLDLLDHLRTAHEGTSRHRGRCRPFGEANTFAALQEVVGSIARIPPGSADGDVRARLHAEVATLDLDPGDRDWLAARLHALVGLPVDDEAPAESDEMFAAWARYLEVAAARVPLALVIEDLHWADDALLDFLEHVMEHAADVPLVLACTARPELFARRPGWAAGVANATTISLTPLTDPEMSELLAGLLLRAKAPTAEGSALLARAGGNPLYAREFVHMLEDQTLMGDRPRPIAGSGGDAIPDTVHALIGARLDALDGPDRALLQLASVVGDRFWRGVLDTLEPDAPDLDGSLRTLQRRGLIRGAPTSSIDGQTEFSFTHALIRDVSYGRLPRAVRSRLHRDVASWLESEATRMPAQADLQASHATRALDLAMAAGLDDEVPGLATAALRSLRLAGDRQQSLDAARAADYYGRALALSEPGAERAELRRTATSLRWRSGALTSDAALEEYREAEREATAAGDPILAARVLRRIYFQLGLRGETTAARQALEHAITLVERDPEGREVLAELLACRSEAEMFAGRSDESRRWAEQALELPRTQSVTLMALHLRGNARCETGDLGGVDDLRKALEIAEASGVAIDIVTSYSYLLEWVGLEDGPAIGLPMNRATADLCRRRGIEGQGMWTRAEGFWLRFDAGLWNELIEEAEELEAWAEPHGDAQIATVAKLYRARVLAHRGNATAATELTRSFLPSARQIEDLQVLAPALMVASVAHAAAGDMEQAVSHARAFDVTTANGPTEYRELYLPEIVRALITAGEPDTAARIVGDRTVHVRRTRLAVASSWGFLELARGEFDAAAAHLEESASAWYAWGGVFECGHALAGCARALQALNRVEEAETLDARARAMLDRL